MKRVLWLSFGLLACGKSQTAGVNVIFRAPAQSNAASVSLPSGRTWTVSEAKVTVHRIELEACPTTAERVGQWLLPSAWAHSSTNVASLEGPFEIDLLGNTETVWGRIDPPAGAYCHAHVIVSAEAPTRHEGAEHEAEESAGLHVAAVDAADATQTFDLAVSQELEVEHEAAFTLSKERPSARVEVKVSLAKLLAGVDEAVEAERANKLAANLDDALTVEALVAMP